MFPTLSTAPKHIDHINHNRAREMKTPVFGVSANNDVFFLLFFAHTPLFYAIAAKCSRNTVRLTFQQLVVFSCVLLSSTCLWQYLSGFHHPIFKVFSILSNTVWLSEEFKSELFRERDTKNRIFQKKFVERRSRDLCGVITVRAVSHHAASTVCLSAGCFVVALCHKDANARIDTDQDCKYGVENERATGRGINDNKITVSVSWCM